MEHVLRNALLLLLDQPSATLADILPLLTDKQRRRSMLVHAQNQQVKLFWQKEFPAYSFRYQADGIAPILNKVGAFLADPRLRRFLVDERPGLRLRKVMDSGQVLLVDLAQGKIGSDSAFLLGGLLITALGSAAFSRSGVTEAQRRPFHIYVDEFQNFTTLALATMLSELRKYGVGMILAHQYLGQLEPKILDAILGNVGTIVAFRVGAQDARLLEHEFAPTFSRQDLVRLPNREIYVKLMNDGVPSRPFSAQTVHPARLIMP